jgi:protein-S-isoprenylcysteine O-methyltransferase Ste14
MAAYFVIFSLIHSLLADHRIKSRAEQVLPDMDRWYRLAYSILAALMVLPFFYILIFLPDEVLYVVAEPWMWLMVSGQIASVVCLLAALRQTGLSYFLGLSQLLGQAAPPELVTDGFYCHLRNPLFLFAALFLWLTPLMTANLLAFNILATVYFYAGARHEERSLKEEFGQEYEEYRRRVPMFIPRMTCKKVP